MSRLLLISAVGVPLFAALCALFASARPYVARLLPLLPVPALLAAVLVPETTEVASTWLLFSGNWSLDSTRSVLLAAMSLVWCVGGWHALTSPDTRDRLSSLALPWSVALTGNMWAAIAQDIAGFYSGFALMSFAAYGLIVHSNSDGARAAGRLYLAFTVLGEVAILSGLILASHAGAGDSLDGVSAAINTATQPQLITLLLLTGFGVKCALLGTHLWLPSVYTHAPAPVRVVLGGAMINAGVLGWLATLPIGSSVATPLAMPLVIAGLIAALGAALLGVMQSRAPTVLAYSSISQMGLITVLVGVALSAFGARPELLAALTVFAAHHGITKGALFVSVDAIEAQPSRWPLLILPALALTGAPFTSGALAKLMMKHAVYDVGWSWLSPWLSVAAIGTTVLMARALWCAMHGRVLVVRGLLMLGVAATVLVATAVFWLPSDSPALPGANLGDAIALLWPIAVGVALSALAWHRRIPAWRDPAGDALPLLVSGTHQVIRMANAGARVASTSLESVRTVVVVAMATASHFANPERSEAWLRRHASFSFVILLLVMIAALAVG